MNRKILILFVVLLALLSLLGARNVKLAVQRSQIFSNWQRDSLRYAKQLEEQQTIISALKPSDNLIQPSTENLPSSLSDPYLSASQGVEVHLEGIRWEGQWFKPNQTNGIDRMGGISEVQINQIIFDPDFPKSGMPDLNVEVTAPRFFEMKSFLSEWLGGFDLSGFLGQSFADREPIKTFDLQTTGLKKQKMSLWLMEFDAFLRIEPSPNYDNTNVGGLENHPVTGAATRKIRGEIEAKNQRYGNVSVMLKFKPKDGTWYIAERDETGMLVPDGAPKVGVGAVECIGIKQESENKNLNNIGVYLRKGSSLALFNAPNEIDSKFSQQGINPDEVVKPIDSKLYGTEVVANPNFFGKEKYAIIHLANLGSWQEGSWLSSVKRYADQYHARFVIHTYVLGEWNVQPVSIAKPESRPPFSQRKAGVLDFILPDFNLGWFGKLLSGGGWVIVGLIALSIFFPPLGMLVNKLLGWLVKLIPGKD